MAVDAMFMDDPPHVNCRAKFRPGFVELWWRLCNNARCSIRRPPQAHHDIVGSLNTSRRIFGQARAYHAINDGRRKRLHGGNRFRLLLQNGGEHAERRFTFESAMSSNHLVENTAQAEDVTARVGLRALQNFGGQIYPIALARQSWRVGCRLMIG